MPQPTLQDYQRHSVRAAAALTNSFVAGTDISEVADKNQLILDVDVTLGSLSSAEVLVEFSENGIDFIQQTIISAAGTGIISSILATNQMTADGKYRLEIPFMARIIRVSAKGTGTVTGSSMSITALTGVK